MIRAVRSYVAGMRASARLGRAFRFRRNGQNELAMSAAREALAALLPPYVKRSSPPEGAALLGATVLVEEIAAELHVPGATLQDLADALAYLRFIEGGGSEYDRWIPYLQHRVSQETGSAV